MKVAELPLTENSRIVFSTEELRGNLVASIRVYIDSLSYSGPTVKGVTTSPEILREVVKVAKKIKSPELKTSKKEKIFTKIKINDFRSVVLHLSLFKEKRRLDLREYYTSDSYTGYGKRGIAVPIEKADEFIKNLIELLGVIEAEETKLPQQEKLIPEEILESSKEKIPEEEDLEIPEEVREEQLKEAEEVVQKTKKVKAKEGKFARFFTYYYEIFKHRATVTDATDLYKAVDYFDLSDFLEEEVLFSGKTETLTFELPEEELVEKIKNKDKLKPDEWTEQLEKAQIQLTAFSKIKELFLTYQEKSYEVELYVGFPLLSFHSSKGEHEDQILAPLFLAKAEIIYEVANNDFKLSLITDNFQLNLALAGKLTTALGKEYVQEKLIEAKPNLPLSEKPYRTFLGLLRDLLELELGKLPKDLEIDDKSIGELLRDEEKYNISNKPVVFLARRGDFYILDDLHKLSELDEEVGETILSKFFSHDAYSPGNGEEGHKSLLPETYLFPFASNSDQRKIVGHASWPLVLVEGPPGTGKSQTISNLICHLVANGKRVLVSSQKNKALEVVDQKIDDIGIQYLQMTLLKNDTKAKKRLIEEINELDYYLRGKTEFNTETKIEKLKGEYQETEREINDLSVLFQRTLAAEEENAELYKKYSKVRHLNLIVDNVLSLEEKDIPKIKEKLLRLISLYTQCLDQEQKVRELLILSKCSPEQLKEGINLLKRWNKLRAERAKLLQVKDLLFIKKEMFPPASSVVKVNMLAQNSTDLVNYVQEYRSAEESLSIAESKIDRLAQDLISGDLTDQSRIVEDLKPLIPNLKANKKYTAVIDSKISLADLEKIKATTESLKKKRFPYSLPLLKKLLLLRHRKFIKDTEVIKNLHPEEVLELERALDYWISYRMIEKLTKRFILPEQLERLLKSDRWTVEREIESLEKLLVAVKAKWYINQILKTKLGLKDEDLKILKRGFRSLDELASTIQSHFELQKTEWDLSVLLIKLEGVLRNYYSEVENLLTGSNKKAFDTLNEIFQKAYFYSLSKPLEKEVYFLRNTIQKFRESIKNNDKFHIKFSKNIDGVFKCELLDNEIKKLEKEFPLSTQDIAEKLSALKNKRTELITQLIQTSIDLNLIRHYQKDNRVQRELAYFRKQLRRSKKAYSTFDEMKKEFDFSSLLNIFPCWIMGIDDVSRIFPLVAGLFDYVIFDESSQCNLASSIPALFRGKQTIIVGDDKQLSDFTRMWIPPRFNELLIKNLRLREIPKFDALDARHNSLFDTCSVFSDRRVLLTEHFRSYPEIVNFSNQRFYRNKLRIMTNSLNNDLGEILNVVEVKGAAENEMKINEKEAQAILEKLKEIVRDPAFHDKSIGVLSLFREQANYLHKLIFEDDLLRAEIEDHGIITDTVDGFQGDERDVILYSFRYAPNSTPAIFTFTRTEDGWRRVNVAFTRPRKKVFCFISRNIDEFPSGYVKEFLQYAKDGYIEESKLKEEFDSDFEKDVYALLSRYKDIKVLPQFKTCGFKIDFVVTKNGRALALECDGMFHYDEHGDLVEEDVERQDILERAQWTVKRLTSREFYRDPEGSIRKNLNHLDQ